MRIVLDSFGSALIKKDDTLVVKNKDGSFEIDTKKVDTIIISRGALVSSDAIIFALEHSIDIVFTDRSGRVKGRAWSPHVGAVALIRRKQLEFSFSSEAVKWIKDILLEKITNQIALLMAFDDPSQKELHNKILSALNKLQDYKSKIRNIKGDFISDVASSLRGWEGAASRVYFSIVGQLVLEKYRTNSRSHPAKDVFNAFLNYAYGILYGKIESALIKAGIDPYIGVFHRENYGRPVLTFDVIERYRHWADYVVINILRQDVVDEECYSINEEGHYWLEPLGKRIIIQAMYDYLDEPIKIKNKQTTREGLINSYSIDLAKKFLRFKSNLTRLHQLRNKPQQDVKDDIPF